MTHAERYDKLTAERDYYLNEAHRSALVTIPSLFPDQQDIRHRQPNVELPKPFQSLGARAINNLASKLLLTLFPPTAPFLRYEILADADDTPENAKLREQIQRELALREAAIQREVDTQGMRVKINAALKQLLVAGNALVYLDPTGGLQVFPLSAYVAQRDGMGNVLEFTYVEVLDRASISDERILDILAVTPGPSQPEESAPSGAKKPVDAVLVYTNVVRDGDRFFASKEVEGQVYDTQSFSEDTLPWLVLRFTSIDGEDYGRGMVEEYRGDFSSFEKLSEAIVFASLNAAFLIPLVAPNGTVSMRDFKKVQNGQPLLGTREDIDFLSVDKGADMQVANATRRELQQAIAADFLLNSSFQRPGERVTAEEIRRMAEELEDTLGGTFSVLSQEFQLPLARLLEQQLIANKRIDPLPTEQVRLAVVTGLAAIGRGHDLQRLREFLAMASELATIFPGVVDFLPEGDILRRLEQGSGIEPLGIKTDSDVAEQRAARQQAQAEAAGRQTLAEKGTGPLVQGVVDSMSSPTQES